MKIVIVEKSPIVRQSLKKLLSNVEGVGIPGQADNWVSAVESIATHRPDVVLLGISIPPMNSLDVLANAVTLNPKSTFIVLTDHVDKQTEGECRRRGAKYFFDKNNDIELLLETLRSLQRTSPQAKRI